MEALERGQGPEYGTDECRLGLRLDPHPETVVFPAEFPIVPPGGLERLEPK